MGNHLRWVFFNNGWVIRVGVDIQRCIVGLAVRAFSDPVHDPKKHDPEWTPSRMDTIPNGHHPEWTPSRMDTIPNGHNPEWTQSQMDTIPNGHNPERTQSRMSTYNYIVTLVSNSYCLVRSLLQRRGFKQKLILCMNLSDL